MAGESSADSSMSIEMAGRAYAYELSTSSGMTLVTEGESSSTHDHSSTTMPCSYCRRPGASAFVIPPSGSLYLCTFDVPEDLLFHPQVAMKLNGVRGRPRGAARRKTIDIPMLSLQEEKVKKPARKTCRNCRAAAPGPNLSIMNAPIDSPPRQPAAAAQQNVRVVVPDGTRGWYISLPPRSQEFVQRRRACADCNVNGQQHLVRIPDDSLATEIMIIPTSQVLLHMLDRLPVPMHGFLLSQVEMNVKWTPMEFRDEEMISQPAGDSGTDSAGSSSENLGRGFYEGFTTYFRTRSQWAGRRKVYLGAFDPNKMCMYVGLWKSKEDAAHATGMAATLSLVVATPAQIVVSTA